MCSFSESEEGVVEARSLVFELIRSLIEQRLHQVNQFLLVLTIHEILAHLNLFILLESSLDSVSDSCGSLDVELNVDLAVCALLEVVEDLLLFLR